MARSTGRTVSLSETLPAIYTVDGVAKVGKTSLHGFTEAGAAFADGTLNTILAVQAGADTADIWTKPGGLDFDPKAPIRALGMIADELNQFAALMTDGSVRRISITLPAETLLHLIQHRDGQLVDGF